jgi:hypothetical protein
MEITIVGQNDHRPVMDKEFYNFFVAYDEKNYFVIGNVSASDQDSREYLSTQHLIFLVIYSLDLFATLIVFLCI